MWRAFIMAILLCNCGLAEEAVRAQQPSATVSASPEDIPEADLIHSDQLSQELKMEKAPFVLQVGSHLLYREAHILGAEYVGAAGTPEGLAALDKRVSGLSHDQAVVIYCGCCPWTRCPNIRAAYQELRKLGFSNVRALYLPQNLGTDWTNKGYPVAKEQ